jgi:hypothetical protein
MILQLMSFEGSQGIVILFKSLLRCEWPSCGHSYIQNFLEQIMLVISHLTLTHSVTDWANLSAEDRLEYEVTGGWRLMKTLQFLLFT